VRSPVTRGAVRGELRAPISGSRAEPPAGGEALLERSPPLRRWDVRRGVRVAAALLGLTAIAAYLVIAVARLTYPFPLEWLEGNSLVEVQRILTGRPLYAAPTVGYVPDGYPPLYFIVSAAAAKVLGVSYLPLRLVSLLSSLACFAVLARLVQRETSSAAAGIAAAGLLAATYFATDTWFDAARVDSLFLAFSIAGLYAARWMRRTRGAVAAGLLLAAACLTKQNGLAEGVAVLTALTFGSHRRLAARAALTYGAVLGISTVALQLLSHGWYAYYVLTLMSRQGLNDAAFGSFWTEYLLPTLGIACLALIFGARRTCPVLLAGCAALFAEGYITMVNSGSAVNDLLPACLAVVLLAGLSMGDQPGALLSRYADRLALMADRPKGRSGPWIAAATTALVVAQLATLISGFHAGLVIPSSADRAVGERLAAGIRALGGTIAIPADPGLSVMAGLPPVAHQSAADDVLSVSGTAAAASFARSAARAVAAHRFSVIVTDYAQPPREFAPDLMRYYRRCPQMLLAGLPPRLFEPVDGIQARPAYVWLPIGRGSCTRTIRALDGQAASAQAVATASGGAA